MTMNDFRATAPAPAAPRPFHFPAVERLTLPNGLRILLAPTHAAPVASVRAVVRDGADRDPSGRAGLASMTAEMIDEGTSSRSAIDIATEVADLGAALGTGCDWDGSYVSLDLLGKNIGKGLEIFADVMLNPAFDDRELERVRDERLTTILQNRDEPAVIAAETFAKVVFEGTPYGTPSIGSEESISAITRDELRGFWSARYTPSSTSLIVTGEFDRNAAVASLERHFGAWRGPERTAPDWSNPKAATRASIVLVDRPQAVQSEIRVGHVGVDRSCPDYFAIVVMNAILGGVFTSRLNMNLRERNGFTYHVRSGFGFRRHAGPFVTSTAVRNDVTAAAIREILGELRRIGSGDVTAQELNEAKSYLAGSFPMTVQTAGNLATRIEEIEIHGLPDAYFDTYRENLSGVTAADVERVAKRYIHPERATIVVVGKAGEVRGPLEAMGMEVRRWE